MNLKQDVLIITKRNNSKLIFNKKYVNKLPWMDIIFDSKIRCKFTKHELNRKQKRRIIVGKWKKHIEILKGSMCINRQSCVE